MSLCCKCWLLNWQHGNYKTLFENKVINNENWIQCFSLHTPISGLFGLFAVRNKSSWYTLMIHPVLRQCDLHEQSTKHAMK